MSELRVAPLVPEQKTEKKEGVGGVFGLNYPHPQLPFIGKKEEGKKRQEEEGEAMLLHSISSGEWVSKKE